MAKRKRKTIVAFLLDETGSMQSYKQSTMDGYNEYVNTLKNDKDGNYAFTLTKFNSEKVEVVLDAVPIKDVPELTDETYNPGYTTPLYDAIGRTIKATEKQIEGVRGKPAVLLVIMTDGLENASQEFTRDGAFSLIKEKGEAGWTFAYLGANQDAYAAGGMIGIPKGNIMQYQQGQEAVVSAAMGRSTMSYASSGSEHTENLFSDKERRRVEGWRSSK